MRLSEFLTRPPLRGLPSSWRRRVCRSSSFPSPASKELRASDLDSRAFRALAFTYVRQRFADTIVYVICAEAREVGHGLAARMFIPQIPRVEDPATGAAAASQEATASTWQEAVRTKSC